jgi:hypothetical protein
MICPTKASRRAIKETGPSLTNEPAKESSIMHKEIKSSQQYKKIHHRTGNVILPVCTELEETTAANAILESGFLVDRVTKTQRRIQKHTPMKICYDYR